MLPRCWDLGHWHCWEGYRCYWLQNWGHCLHCSAFQGGRGRRRSELEPGAAAEHRLGSAWGWWDDWEPDAGWGTAAAAAGPSSPPEAGGGSSCERFGIWFCRTFWSEGRKREDCKSKPSVGSHWDQTLRVCPGAPSGTTGSTHLPHSLQGKKLANGGTGTTSSCPNCLLTGWQVGVTCGNRTNCKLPCCDWLAELHSTSDNSSHKITHILLYYTTHTLLLFLFLCVFLFYESYICQGLECMTRWSAQSIMGREKPQQENNDRTKERDRKRTRIKPQKGDIINKDVDLEKKCKLRVSCLFKDLLSPLIGYLTYAWAAVLNQFLRAKLATLYQLYKYFYLPKNKKHPGKRG